MRKLFFMVLSVVFLPLVLFAASLGNEHLMVEVDESNGGIQLSTTGDRGSEEKGRVNLLFYDVPSTSYVLVQAGDGLFTFGSTEGRFTVPPVTGDGFLTSVWENRHVSVTQRVSFFRRKETGVEDGILIQYSVVSRNGGDAAIGVSLIFDTCLGERSGSPFLLPDGRKLTRGTVLEGEEIVDYWLSLDAEGGSGACLRGVLRGPGLTPPDKVLFGNYRFLKSHSRTLGVETEADFSYGSFSRRDGAVLLSFTPVVTAPGAQREYRAILGLCGEGEYGEREIGGSPEPGESRGKTPPAEGIPITEEPAGTPESLDKIEQIDKLIEELNRYLESATQPVSEEEIRELRSNLEQLRGQEETGPED